MTLPKPEIGFEYIPDSLLLDTKRHIIVGMLPSNIQLDIFPICPNKTVSYTHILHLFYSRPIEVDYDTDDSGLYRARGENEITKDAKVILDSTVTKTDTPLDLQATQQIDEEDLRKSFKKFYD